MENPVQKFEHWWQEALTDSPLNLKSAACLSTINEDGYPTARFVDLKSADERGFVFCTCLDSAKGKHLQRDPKTAMTIWWDHVGYQVRVVGKAEVISAAEAYHFWSERSRSAQLTTTAFEQSRQLATENELAGRLKATSVECTGRNVPRPNNWGGYRIRPASIEFLTFKENRLHLRELYKRERNHWIKQLLQP